MRYILRTTFRLKHFQGVFAPLASLTSSQSTGNPFLGTKLLGFSTGRGSGALKGLILNPKSSEWSPLFLVLVNLSIKINVFKKNALFIPCTLAMMSVHRVAL